MLLHKILYNFVLLSSDITVTSTSMQWTMPAFSIGDTLSALVLHVVDPGLFYVIPKELKGKKVYYANKNDIY